MYIIKQNRSFLTKERVVIVPGNGRGDVEHSNWYGWLKNKLLEVSLPEEFGLQPYVFIPY